jgi:hypothetical protein
VQQAEDSEFEHPAALSGHGCPHLPAWLARRAL